MSHSWWVLIRRCSAMRRRYHTWLQVAVQQARATDESCPLMSGNVSRLGGVPIPVRIHSECLLGDVFDSTRCQCGPQLRDFMLNVLGNDEHRNGAMLYLQAGFVELSYNICSM